MPEVKKNIYKDLQNYTGIDHSLFSTIGLLISEAYEFHVNKPEGLTDSSIDYGEFPRLFVYTDMDDDNIQKSVLVSKNGAGVVYIGLYNIENTWQIDPCIAFVSFEDDVTIENAFFTRVDKKEIEEDDMKRIMGFCFVANAMQYDLQNTETPSMSCV